MYSIYAIRGLRNSASSIYLIPVSLKYDSIYIYVYLCMYIYIYMFMFYFYIYIYVYIYIYTYYFFPKEFWLR